MKGVVLRIQLCLFSVMFTVGASAQLKTSYFMENSISRYEMNAAYSPDRGFINMPMLGSVGINANNNFWSVRDFIHKYGNTHVTALHESVSARSFLKKIPERSSLDIDINYNIVGFGKYAKRRDFFWYGGWNVRFVTDVVIPKPLFRVLKDLRNGSFNIGDVSFMTSAYSEFVAGVTIPTGWKNLVVGGRLKLLVGLFDSEMRLNHMNISVSNDEVSAEFSGKFKGSVFGMNYDLLTNDLSGHINFDDLTDFSNYFSMDNSFKSWGAAIDLGAEMKFLNDRLKASVAVNDFGFICWGGANAIYGVMDNLRYEYTGLNTGTMDVNFTEDGSFGDLTKTGSRGRGYTRWLAAVLNAGVEYNFLDNLLGVGVLSHTKFVNRVTFTELTLTGTYRPVDWFSVAASHTFIRNKPGIFGLALHFNPRVVNIFIGADYIPFRYASYEGYFRWPLRARSLNFHFGLSFDIGRSRPW